MALLTRPKALEDWYTTSSGTNAAQIARNTYNDAVHYFEKELSQDKKMDLSWIHQAHSIDEVGAATEKAMSAYSAAANSSSMKRNARQWTVAFSSRVVYYGEVLDTLAQHHPEYVALAWGAIKFVLMGVLNHAEILTEFTKAMSEIGDVLPRIDLQARLYPSDHIQSVVARVYAHIMLFMQQAVKWCYLGSFRRIVSSYVKPWTLSYQETVDQIRSLVATVDADSSAAAGAELRGVSLSLTEHDKKLNDLRTQVDKAVVLVNQVLGIANSESMRSPKDLIDADSVSDNFNLSQNISVKIDDQTLRLCDLQYSEILSLFRPDRPPEDVLHSCRSIARRRKLWTQPMLHSSNFLSSFKDWCSAAGSVLFIVHASLRAEATTKDLALEAVTFFQASSFKVIWFFSERLPTSQKFGIGYVLKSLIYQILYHDSNIIQHDPQNVNISKFRQLSDTELQDLLVFLLLQLSTRCFLVVETESLFASAEDGKEWCRLLENVFQRVVDAVDARNGTVKVLLVTYGSSETGTRDGGNGNEGERADPKTERRLTTTVRTNRLPIAKMRMMLNNSRKSAVQQHMMRSTTQTRL